MGCRVRLLGGSHPHPFGKLRAGSALSRRGRGGKSPHLNLPPKWGKRGITPARPPSGFRPRIEYGAGSSASSGQALRGNHPCRLRPAHQGMKMAPPPPVRVDDSNRGLDTGPVSSTGQAFRRYDDVGVSPLFWYQRRVRCGRLAVTRGASGLVLRSRWVRHRDPARASAVRVFP